MLEADNRFFGEFWQLYWYPVVSSLYVVFVTSIFALKKCRKKEAPWRESRVMEGKRHTHELLDTMMMTIVSVSIRSGLWLCDEETKIKDFFNWGSLYLFSQMMMITNERKKKQGQE